MAESMLNIRSRNWCFTAFEEDAFQSLDKATGEGSGVGFWCYGNEVCPETKKAHRQGYMEFKAKKSLRSLKKMFHRAIHWEIRRGSAKQATDYCAKDGDFYSFGVATQQGKRSDLLLIQEEMNAGASVSTIADNHFAKWCQYGRQFAVYAQLKQPDRNWITEVHVIWGPTGTGKTYECVHTHGGSLIEFDKNGFLHGYTNQEVVVLDDFDDRTLTRCIFLRLMDRYSATANTKGGTAKWNPRKVFITTNYDPRKWYGGCPAVQDRITSITHMSGINRRQAARVQASTSAAGTQPIEPSGASPLAWSEPALDTDMYDQLEDPAEVGDRWDM